MKSNNSGNDTIITLLLGYILYEWRFTAIKKEKLRANIDKQIGIPTGNNTLNQSGIDIPKHLIFLSVIFW